MPTPQDTLMFAGDSTICQGVIPSHGFTAGQFYEWIHAPGWYEISSTQQDLSWFPDFGKQYYARTGRTSGALLGGDSGTNLLQHWDPSGGRTSYDKALAQSADANPASVLAVVVHLGPNSVQNGTSPTAANYRDGLMRLAAGFAADLPGAPPTYINIFSSKGAASWSGGTADPDFRAGMDAVHSGTMLAVAAGYVRMGAVLLGQVYGDDTHPDSLPLAVEIGGRWDAALAGAHGPRLTSATIDATGKIVRCVFDSLDNTPSDAVSGFRVLDDGTAVTIDSQVVTSAHVVTLTLPDAIVGTCTVSFGSGVDTVGQTLPSITHTMPAGSTVTLPAEPFYNHAVTLASTRLAVSVFSGCLR